MDFSFLRDWLGITNTSTSDVSSIPGDDNGVEEYDNEFEVLEDYEFINLRDSNEVHSLPDQTGESVVEIA
ncbi:MAG: lipase family protein, partial [Rickettsiales bacterium]|nr:lipase family protein [Rickettsiales bacterium]